MAWFEERSKTIRICVYDSLTKGPISQAIIRVYSEDGEWCDRMLLTLKGIFQQDLVVESIKLLLLQGYIFPSSIVFGKDDYPLKDVYHGEYFEVKENEEFNFSIPQILGMFLSLKHGERLLRAESGCY